MYLKQETEEKKVYQVGLDGKKNIFLLHRTPTLITIKERQEVANEFVKKIAKKGLLNNILNKRDVIYAIRTGRLPKKFNVHHYVPLALGGKNEETNLCVIERKLHKWLHSYLLEPIYRDVKLDGTHKKSYLELPMRQEVFLVSDAHVFFTEQEIEGMEEDLRTGKMPVYRRPNEYSTDYVSSMRFAEQLKRDMPFCDDEEEREKSEQIIGVIERKIRARNTEYRRKGVQIRKFWNERREGKTREPMGRKDKAELSAKKARKVASKRWYPHLVAIRFSKDEHQR